MLQVFGQIENGMLSPSLELGNGLPHIAAQIGHFIIEWLYYLFGELIFQLFLCKVNLNKGLGSASDFNLKCLSIIAKYPNASISCLKSPKVFCRNLFFFSLLPSNTFLCDL